MGHRIWKGGKWVTVPEQKYLAVNSRYGHRMVKRKRRYIRNRRTGEKYRYGAHTKLGKDHHMYTRGVYSGEHDD